MIRKSSTPKPRSLVARLVRVGLVAGTCALGIGLAPACLNRDVAKVKPQTTNVFVEKITQNAVDKIDMLFMIDNSISMADKQEILGLAVPKLLDALLQPVCINVDGNNADRLGNGECPDGFTEEFEPLKDIHIGVVSSSLGGHGGVICTPEVDGFVPEQDDQGMLIAPKRDVRSYAPAGQEMGYLKWDQTAPAKYQPPGTTSRLDIVSNFTQLVTATGEDGCGYEAGLEAWYRFLIDPQPPVSVTKEGQATVLGPVNSALLEQRSWFLRPDSLVAIVMLSDENDCSVRDDQVSWLIGDQNQRIPRGTAACAEEPNSPCCRSCRLAEAAPPEGCIDLTSDPECAKGSYSQLEEPQNLRCWDQKRRFGLDFLHHWSRYTKGLLNTTVIGRDCASDADCGAYVAAQAAGTCRDFGGISKCEYPNPLNSANLNYPKMIPRGDSGLVFLAGIIGVPWQDISTTESRENENVLEYLRYWAAEAGEESLQDRWPVIVGDPDANVAPTDPFMIESVGPRLGLPPNPITGDAPQPTDAGFMASPINGHEYNPPALQDDLQYACIFPLGQPKDCATETGGCDCRSGDNEDAPDRPLCQNQSGGYTNTQTYAKAYPGTRFLKVLQEYGLNSIVASVCPKITATSKQDDPAFGYTPAVRAIIDRLKEKLKGTCLPRPLAVRPGSDDDVACEIVEVTDSRTGVTCNTTGRGDPDPQVEEVVRKAMQEEGRCDNGVVLCDDLTFCSILPASASEMQAACQEQPDEGLPNGTYAGYCYIDAMQDLDGDGVPGCTQLGDPDCIGNPDLVADCESTQRRILRFISKGVDFAVPFDNSTIFVACQGKALGSAAAN